MKVEVEVSLYPLAEEYLEHPVGDFVKVLEQHGCTVEHGPMSSYVNGELPAVFEAVRIGYEAVAQKCGCVLILKACNVCPL
ncbi:MAG: thiamine-binding protein [Phycisphaerae bacterium]|nr:thiamine-binding protein [Phycisphaerae bacterium]